MFFVQRIWRYGHLIQYFIHATYLTLKIDYFHFQNDIFSI